MDIASLKDILKTFVQSLQISTSLPAAVLVLFNVCVVFPRIFSNIDWAITNEQVALLTGLAVVILSYILYALNTSLIRIAEGYWTEDISWIKSFKEYLRQHQLAEYRKLSSDSSPSGAGRDAAQKLDMLFPSNPNDVMATPLGNAIAAFEDYPYTRYGMDAIVLWPRLVPILRENKYLEFVAEQKTHFDFMLNMTLAILLCGTELIYLMAYLSYVVEALLSLLLIASLVWLFYLLTISRAVAWGLSVRVAFDLHRYGLWEQLRLKPVTSYKKEYASWQKISEFILYRKDQLDYDGFSYEKGADKPKGLKLVQGNRME